jgi:RimJ/RimL family protein N-acetyltransferase
MKLKQYLFLSNNKLSCGKYSITPLRKSDIQKIRKWRNEQINVLRQLIPLTKDVQSKYFTNIIEKSFYKYKPNIILFSFLYDKNCIGYGGLVHINWNSKRGEVSFIDNTERANSKILYQKDFSVFLKLLFKISFDDMDFNKITTETFDVRPWTTEVLENQGFKIEGKLKKHILIDNKLHNSILHAKFKNN